MKYFLASSFNLDSRANIKCEKCQENLQKHLTTIDFFVAFKVKHAMGVKSKLICKRYGRVNFEAKSVVKWCHLFRQIEI